MSWLSKTFKKVTKAVAPFMPAAMLIPGVGGVAAAATGMGLFGGGGTAQPSAPKLLMTHAVGGLQSQIDAAYQSGISQAAHAQQQKEVQAVLAQPPPPAGLSNQTLLLIGGGAVVMLVIAYMVTMKGRK